MPDAPTKAEREAQWWAEWWRQDFTWKGLARRPFQGWVVAEGHLREAETGRAYGQPEPVEPEPASGEAATLQDYWRADPATGRLRGDSEMVDEWVEEGGKPLFHRMHLPIAWQDGTPTSKTKWADDALDPIMHERLAAASETFWEGDGDEFERIGADRCAQFNGAVLLAVGFLAADAAKPLSLSCESTCFTRSIQFHSATFVGIASFAGANFMEYANFRHTQFLGSCMFFQASFWDEADFFGATCSGLANFLECAFDRQCSFGRVSFLEDSDFSKSTFLGNSGFLQASFSASVRFVDCGFWGSVNFKRSTFLGDATFDDSGFRRKLRLDGAKFFKSARFRNCVFSERAWFDDVQFGHARFGSDLDFCASIFEKLVSFERIEWPGAGQDWHRAFNQVLFRGTLNLTGSGFKAFAAFDGATLDRGLQLDETDEDSAKATFRDELRSAKRAARADGVAFRKAEIEKRAERDGELAALVSDREVSAFVASQREARLRELERGCRVLKQAMETSSNKSREQLFYRFELQARRAQKNLPFGETTFSWLYEMSSDYGASMWRPFAALGVLMAAFAAVFYGWGYGLDPAALETDGLNGVFQALDLSWGNVFKPLSALSTENDFKDKNALAFRLLYDTGGGVDGTGFAVRAVSTLQSLLAIVLAFLFALAVRRRFQIS